MENNNIDKQEIEIMIEGLSNVMQYLILTDRHDKECNQSCFTVALVRSFMQSLIEEVEA